MTKMNGELESSKPIMSNDLLLLYLQQMSFQQEILKVEGEQNISLPADDSKRFHYHVSALVEEMGEILKADKRWKTHRNTTYVRSEKLDEYADLLITVLNIAIFSGFEYDEIIKSVENKISENFERLKGK